MLFILNSAFISKCELVGEYFCIKGCPFTTLGSTTSSFSDLNPARLACKKLLSVFRPT